MSYCTNSDCLCETRKKYMVSYGTQVVEVYDNYVCKPCAIRTRNNLVSKGYRNVRILQHDPVNSIWPLHLQYT
jgi:hypothetical protein